MSPQNPPDGLGNHPMAPYEPPIRVNFMAGRNWAGLRSLDPLIRTKLQDELLDLQKRRNRTIIFVSHDLDEAFKIGNRIAIMEGGRIVQCGSPRDIFTNPSDAYVAEFVAHMNPLGVLTAQDVMTDGTCDGAVVDVEMPVKDIIEQIKNGQPLDVHRHGKPVGQITQSSLLARLTA